MIVCDKDYLLIFDHHCIFRLANIQRTLLESGAEATAEGEQGGREELEVNLRMFQKCFKFQYVYGMRYLFR